MLTTKAISNPGRVVLKQHAGQQQGCAMASTCAGRIIEDRQAGSVGNGPRMC
jgi:hypothetical protein